MADSEAPLDQEEVQKTEEDQQQPKESQPAADMDKKTQKLIADLKRCRIQMANTKKSIQKPPVQPFTPDIFNSLSPYYNAYTVNYLLKDLENQDDNPLRRPYNGPGGWGHRATALGVLEPEKAWRMDHDIGPVNPSRIPGALFRSKTWAKNMSGSSKDLGSTRLPPLPMPSVPKFHQANFRPLKMTFDDLADFRSEMKNVKSGLEEKRAKKDYDRTVMDWERMNLSELKNLPVQSRYHVKKAIHSYLGTSTGSAKALKPLTKQIWNDKEKMAIK